MAVRKLYDDDDGDTPEPIFGFDTSSGISEAEQKDILTEIDELAAQSRFAPTPDDLKANAKKRGVLFPVLVNFFVLLLLGGGLFALFSLQTQDEPLYLSAGGDGFSLRRDNSAVGSEPSAVIEEQLKGFYTALSVQVQEGRLPEAVADLQTMREFIDDPSFQQSRLVQSRKEFYLASINALSDILFSETSRFQQSFPEAVGEPFFTPADQTQVETIRREYEELIADLKSQNEALEQTLADRERTILDFAGQSQSGAPPDYEEASAALKTQNASLQKSVTALRSQITALQQQVTALKTQNTNYQQTITALRTQNTNLQQTAGAANTLKTQNTNLQQVITAHENSIRDFMAQNESLKQTLSAREGALNDLRAQNANLQQSANELRNQSLTVQQNIGVRDGTINDLRAQNANLQQSAAELRNQNVNLQQSAADLRAQNANLQQAVTDLRAQNANLQQSAAELRNQNVNLQQNINAHDGTLNELRGQTASLQQAVAVRDSTIGDLRVQTANLQQSVSARDSAISELRTQNANLQQTAGELRTQNANLQQTAGELRTQNANLNLMVDQLRQTNEAVRRLLGTQ